MLSQVLRKSSTILQRVLPEKCSRTGDHVQCICVCLRLGSAHITLNLQTQTPKLTYLVIYTTPTGNGDCQTSSQNNSCHWSQPVSEIDVSHSQKTHKMILRAISIIRCLTSILGHGTVKYPLINILPGCPAHSLRAGWREIARGLVQSEHEV